MNWDGPLHPQEPQYDLVRGDSSRVHTVIIIIAAVVVAAAFAADILLAGTAR